MIQINETDNFIQICDYHFQSNSPKSIKDAINGINCYLLEGVVGSHETEATNNNVTYTNLEELLKIIDKFLDRNINGYYRMIFKKRNSYQKTLI